MEFSEKQINIILRKQQLSKIFLIGKSLTSISALIYEIIVIYLRTVKSKRLMLDLLEKLYVKYHILLSRHRSPLCVYLLFIRMFFFFFYSNYYISLFLHVCVCILSLDYNNIIWQILIYVFLNSLRSLYDLTSVIISKVIDYFQTRSRASIS